MGKSVKVHASLENAVSDYKLDFITALPNFENTALSSHSNRGQSVSKTSKTEIYLIYRHAKKKNTAKMKC